MVEALRRPESFDHDTVQVNGVDIHYVLEGAGDPVLLVHGWPGFWWEWHRNISALAEDFTVIVPDMRGYGDSEKPDLSDPSSYQLHHTVEDLAGLLEHLNIGAVNIVGHDWSSLVVHKFIRAHPELTRKAIIMNPLFPGVEERYLSPGHFPESWYSQFHQLPMSAELVGLNRQTVEIYFRHFFSHWSSDPGLFTDEEIEVFVENFMKEDNVEGGFNWYRANLSITSQPWSALDRTPTGIETLILWGMDDPVVPLVWSDYISDWYYNYTFEAVPGAGHWLMREAPDLFNERAKGFFSTRSG